MRNENQEWVRLCEQAAVEQDPERLMKLVQQIVELLDTRRQIMTIDPGIRYAGSSND